MTCFFSQKLEFTLASRSSGPVEVSSEDVTDQLVKMLEEKSKQDLVIEWIEVNRINFRDNILTDKPSSIARHSKLLYTCLLAGRNIQNIIKKDRQSNFLLYFRKMSEKRNPNLGLSELWWRLSPRIQSKVILILATFYAIDTNYVLFEIVKYKAHLS